MAVWEKERKLKTIQQVRITGGNSQEWCEDLFVSWSIGFIFRYFLFLGWDGDKWCIFSVEIVRIKFFFVLLSDERVEERGKEQILFFSQNGTTPATCLRVVGRVDFVLVAVEVKLARPPFPCVVNFSDWHHSDLLSLYAGRNKQANFRLRTTTDNRNKWANGSNLCENSLIGPLAIVVEHELGRC